MSSLKNKIAVVTGGNSGIGFATAKEFIAQGATVVITGRNQAALDKAVTELGNQASAIISDAADLKQTDALVKKVRETYGKVDILFVNAGIFAPAAVGSITEEMFDNQMGINFKGAVFTIEKFLPILRDGASIINLSSVNATAGMPNTAIYGASKAALNAYTRIAATELAPRKIRINAVSPGPINTALVNKAGLPEAAISEFGKAMQNRIPLKKFGQPEDVAKLVSFLASDDAGFITGSEYIIDGGVSINPILG